MLSDSVQSHYQGHSSVISKAPPSQRWKLSVWNFTLKIRMQPTRRELLVRNQKGGLEMLNILISVLSTSWLTTRVAWCEVQRQRGTVGGAQTLEPDSRSWTPAPPLTVWQPAICMTSLCSDFLTEKAGLIALDAGYEESIFSKTLRRKLKHVYQELHKSL